MSELIPDICGDGKIRLRKISYFDCKHHNFHCTDGCWWGKCKVYTKEYYSDCKYMGKDFRKCPHWKLKEKIANKLREQKQNDKQSY